MSSHETIPLVQIPQTPFVPDFDVQDYGQNNTENDIKHSFEPTPVVDSFVTPQVVAEQSRIIPWKWCVLSVWVIGIIVFALRYALDEIQLWRQSRLWQKVDDPMMLELLRECYREVGLWRSVRFLMVPQDIGAASTGFWSCRVLISRTALETMTPQQLRMILVHELVHIRRFDPLVLRVVSLLSVIYWFHPVVWFVLSRLQRDRELACDDAVLHILNKQKTVTEKRTNQKTYGRTVLLFAQREPLPHRFPGLVGASLDYRHKNTTARRIDMILKHKRGTILQNLLGLVLLTLLAAFGLTRAAEKTPPPQNAQTETSTPKEGLFLHGTVIDPDNKPVKGAVVRMRSRDNKPVLTDENGKFQFPVPEILISGTPFYATLPGTDLVSYQMLPAIPEATKEFPELKMTLEKGRRFFGKVVDESGKPVKDAYVGASEQSLTIEPVLSDAEGNFELYFPQRNAQNVFAIKRSIGFDFTEVDQPWDEPVHGQEVGPLTLTLTKTDPLTVHVEDENGNPLEGINAYPWILNKHSWSATGTNIKHDWSSTNTSVNCESYLATKLGLFSAISDENGNAVIDWLPKGIGMKQDFPGLHDPVMDTRIYVYGTTQYRSAKPIRWRTGITELSATLVKMVRVEGSVRLADGTPVPWASLSYGYNEGGNGWSYADQDGQFHFFLLPHNKMWIAVESQLGAAPAMFNIDAGDGTKSVHADFVLEKGSKLFGTVLTDGKPYRTNISVWEYPEERKKNDKSALRIVQVDENGYFETRLPKGEYQIETWLPKRADYASTKSETKEIKIVDDEMRLDFHFEKDHLSETTSKPMIALNATKNDVAANDKIIVEGRVTDSAGKPVENALVLWKTTEEQQLENRKKAVKTDSAGRYRSPALPQLKGSVTVIAKGFSPEVKEVEFKPNMKPVDFSLKPGKKLEIHFVDDDGKAISGVIVLLGGNTASFSTSNSGWRMNANIYNAEFKGIPETHIPGKADQNGIYRWDWAPEDAVLFSFWKSGYMNRFVSPDLTGQNWMTAREQPYKVVLYKNKTMTGKVVDGTTGKPVEKIQLFPGRQDNMEKNMRWNTLFPSGVTVSGNTFQWKIDYESKRYQFRVEAEGYHPYLSEEFGPGEPDTSFNIALKPDPGLSFTVLSPDGKPLDGVKVFRTIEGESFQVIQTGESKELRIDRKHVAINTDEQGRFTVPNCDEDFLLFLQHPQGTAWITKKDLPQDHVIRLQAGVQVRIAANRDKSQKLSPSIALQFDSNPLGYISYQYPIPENNEVVIDNVMPGNYRVFQRYDYPAPDGSEGMRGFLAVIVPMKIEPDKTNTLDMNFTGQTVSGTVVMPEGITQFRAVKDWEFPEIRLEVIDKKDRLSSWLTTRIVPSEKNPNIGEFTFHNVPSGEYHLHAEVRKSPDTGQARAPEVFTQYDAEISVENSSQKLDIILALKMQGDIVFENGKWKNEKTGKILLPRTLVQGTQGLFRLDQDQNGTGSLEFLNGKEGTVHAKHIRIFDGGNNIIIGSKSIRVEK